MPGWASGRGLNLSLEPSYFFFKQLLLSLLCVYKRVQRYKCPPGETVWKCASLSPIFKQLWRLSPVSMITGFSLCLRVRLSGNGNKHFCLPMWSDSTSCNPVLFSRHEKTQRHADRRADRLADRRADRRVRAARWQDRKTSRPIRNGERHQTCYSVIRLVWSYNDIIKSTAHTHTHTHTHTHWN